MNTRQSPATLRNELLAQKMIQNLHRRHFEAYYCPTGSDAVEQVLSIIPTGSSVTWGGSMTIRDLGITAALKQGQYEVYDRDDVTTPEEKRAVYLKAFSSDFYLCSANAITEDGEVVNVDGNGNRVAAITWGPSRVILVVGMNKVCPDLNSALARARGTAAPINSMRFDTNTPCHTDGRCHDCHSHQCICNYIHVMRNSYPSHRHTIILVGESVGY